MDMQQKKTFTMESVVHTIGTKEQAFLFYRFIIGTYLVKISSF